MRGRPKGPIEANEHQSLGERLKWLRQHQDPYMTQQQLADLSGVSQSFIAEYETGKRRHMSTETIQKLAAALRVRFTIRLKRLSDRQVMECQPEGPQLPFAPKRTGRPTPEARARAAKLGLSPWTIADRKLQARRRKESAGTDGSLPAQGKPRKTASPAKRRDKPSPAPQIPEAQG